MGFRWIGTAKSVRSWDGTQDERSVESPKELPEYVIIPGDFYIHGEINNLWVLFFVRKERSCKCTLLYHDFSLSWSVGIIASTALDTMSFRNPKYNTCASKPRLLGIITRIREKQEPAILNTENPANRAPAH